MPGVRPVLFATLNILQEEVHCRLIVETEAIVYAVFDIEGIKDEYSQYDKYIAQSKNSAAPPPIESIVPTLNINSSVFVPKNKS